MCAKSHQLCWTLCDPMDCSPTGSSVHGIFQARILEWVTMTSSRRSPWHRDPPCISYISRIGRQVLYLALPGKPIYYYTHIKKYFLYYELWAWDSKRLMSSRNLPIGFQPNGMETTITLSVPVQGTWLAMWNGWYLTIYDLHNQNFI